ncbi:MAG: MFS transporter [Pigmentiphaga sp.]|nr:MFS transporter [Pigmentiphaga sp.]
MRQRLFALFNLRREEIRPVLLSGLFFFCVLAALMVVRPAREALGMQRGIEAVRWLFIGTALVTLAVNPVFGWLVSRYRRVAFIAATYGVLIVCLLGFYALLALAPAAVGVVSGQVFYVWFSVFNLFATMLFWALMTDRFTFEQSRRCFALIAVGGTLGAIAGAWMAATLARPLGTPALLLVAAALLMAAVWLAWAVSRSQGGGKDKPGAPAREQTAVIGGTAWAGLRATLQSPYLLGIAAYVVCMTVISTFLYFTRLQMVGELGADMDLRTTWFARIDLITQVATLVLQALVTGHLMQRLGVATALVLLPLTVALGIVGLAIVGSLAALIVLEAAFRAIQRAITRPARETLYTVTSREDKYKSKAMIDTFVYRGGDVLGAQVEGVLARLAPGLAALAGLTVPVALAWAALGFWLARRQRLLAASGTSGTRRRGSSP